MWPGQSPHRKGELCLRGARLASGSMVSGQEAAESQPWQPTHSWEPGPYSAVICRSPDSSGRDLNEG